LGQDAKRYADSFVQKSFDRDYFAVIPEALVVLHLWMHVVQEMDEIFGECEDEFESGRKAGKNTVTDNVDLDVTQGSSHIDKVAAFYIGLNQTLASSGQGELLYALAERHAANFGTQNATSGQANVNSKILDLFEKARTYFMDFDKGCSKLKDAKEKLRWTLDEIVAQMRVPLIQGLLWSLEGQHRQDIQLYATAFVPQLAACRSSTHDFLKSKLLDNEFDADEFNDITDIAHAIESSFSCLRLSCHDIGSMVQGVRTFTSSICDNVIDEMAPLSNIAGFELLADVHEHNRLDLDVKQMNLLMDMGQFEMAKDVYTNGLHSRKIDNGGFHTLQSLATGDERYAIPKYESFTNFHDGDVNYADTAILDLLSDDQSSRYAAASPQQKSQAVLDIVATWVMYVYVRERMYHSLGDCDARGGTAKDTHGVSAWDIGVAYYVGSLEGPDDGGVNNLVDGQFMFTRAKRLASQSITLSPDGSSAVNRHIMDLFASGQVNEKQGNCKAQRAKVQDIDRMLLIPFLQSILKFATLNNALPVASKELSFIQGDIYFRAIAPLLSAHDQIKLGDNLQFQTTYSPMHEGTNLVFDKVANALSFLGLSCEDIGFEMCTWMSGRPNGGDPDGLSSVTLKGSDDSSAGLKFSHIIPNALICVAFASVLLL
jgi:hypothetical protein